MDLDFFFFLLSDRGQQEMKWQLQETELYFVVARGCEASEGWRGSVTGSRVQRGLAKVNLKPYLWEPSNR